MIYWSYRISDVILWRSFTSWENPHDSPVAYFTIQFVLIALQRSNCVSSICNQLTASVQLDIPLHQAYVTCVLMGGISFISGHGEKPRILTQVIWPAEQSVCNNPGVCAHVCVRVCVWVNPCSYYHANGKQSETHHWLPCSGSVQSTMSKPFLFCSSALPLLKNKKPLHFSPFGLSNPP